MSSNLTDKAVVGRRIIHDHAARKQKLPGIITGLNDGEAGGFFVRLDGDRDSVFVPSKFAWRVTFLDEVTEVPALPMGPFTPTGRDIGEYAGVMVCELASEDVIVLTADLKAARTGLTAYLHQAGWDLDYVDWDRLEPRWAVFEWEPEGSDALWTVRWDASEGDDHAVHIYYLPA